MVGRVRELLRLQADARLAPVDPPVAAGVQAVEVVGATDLNACVQPADRPGMERDSR